MARRTALLIGNDDYRDADLQRLIAPWEDVVSLKGVLENFGDFESMSPLYNANLASAQTAIATLFRDAAHDDLVLLYYTGHGVRDEDGDLFLALPDTDVDLLQANAISANFIRDAMRRSHARAQVVILDCCHSGSFKMEGGKRRGGPESLRKDDLLDTDAGDVAAEGKYILTASEPNQSAYEMAGKSVFTRHLVAGLIDGSAAPEKDRVTVQDLHAYVYRMINEDGAPQRPRLMMAASSPELIIARNPNPQQPIKQEILDIFWGGDAYAALGAAYQLIDIASGPDKRLAADAHAVLLQRLEQADAVPLLVAKPIQDWLEPEAIPEALGFSEEQVELLRSESEETRTRLENQISQLEEARASQAAQIEQLQGELAQKELKARDPSKEEQVELIRSEAEATRTQLQHQIGKLEKERSAQADQLQRLQGELSKKELEAEQASKEAAEARSRADEIEEFSTRQRVHQAAKIEALRKTQWTGNQDPSGVFQDGRRSGWRQMALAASLIFVAASVYGFVQHTRVVSELETELSAANETAASYRLNSQKTITELLDELSSARQRIKDLVSDVPAGIDLTEGREAKDDLEVFSDCPTCPDMVMLPGGTFVMGSPEDEDGRYDNEGPQRSVSIRPFAMAATEVTFEQWAACVSDGGCRSNPNPDDEGRGRGSRPVINVSWSDAQEYIDWLNSKALDSTRRELLKQIEGRMDEEEATGRGPAWQRLKHRREDILRSSEAYRLPSEAEWEFAARAGTTTPFAFGEAISLDQANFYGGRPVWTVPVEQLDAANAWGLRHMHGNVSEWVEDCWHGNYDGAPHDGSAWLRGGCSKRVLRGGSWGSVPQNLRSAKRGSYEPDYRYAGFGFRPARTVLTP